jgi:hypothetical protein
MGMLAIDQGAKNECRRPPTFRLLGGNFRFDLASKVPYQAWPLELRRNPTHQHLPIFQLTQAPEPDHLAEPD